MHGDFFAAWDPQVQNALVGACLNAGQSCFDVDRDGGTLTANDNNPITITLADYPSTLQTVVPTPAAPVPIKSALAPKAATTRSAASTASAGSTRAAKPSGALADWGPVVLASGAIGLSLLAIAAFLLRRRIRVQRDGQHRVE